MPILFASAPRIARNPATRCDYAMFGRRMIAANKPLTPGMNSGGFHSERAGTALSLDSLCGYGG